MTWTQINAKSFIIDHCLSSYFTEFFSFYILSNSFTLSFFVYFHIILSLLPHHHSSHSHLHFLSSSSSLPHPFLWILLCPSSLLFIHSLLLPRCFCSFSSTHLFSLTNLPVTQQNTCDTVWYVLCT